MRAKLVNEDLNESKKYKKGDKVKYRIEFSASPMNAESKPEMSSKKVGRISKTKKHWSGRTEYEIGGITIPESDIIGLDESVTPTPFTNNTRNSDIKGPYSLSRVQYEDADKKPIKRSRFFLKTKKIWDKDMDFRQKKEVSREEGLSSYKPYGAFDDLSQEDQDILIKRFN